jgi:hypothetical protein
LKQNLSVQPSVVLQAAVREHQEEQGDLLAELLTQTQLTQTATSWSKKVLPLSVPELKTLLVWQKEPKQ